MPQQLIYTSAPRGIVAGRSGYCTVARSASMREALVLQLEKLSYYQHLSLSGGRERPICAYRIVDIRGSRFHVLTRIQDAGLDFTGRTNFVAHHLALAPEELRQFPTPPVILRDWPGWAKSWTAEPHLLEGEIWSDLTALAGKSSVPAQTWQRVTGDAVNGYGLLESRGGTSFRVDDQPDETVLGLFAESLELLEVRDPKKDFRVAAWQYTFTTSMQEQDNPADFRWRCIHSDNPAASRFATPDCRGISEVRAAKCTGEETALAQTGRQAPRFIVEPRDISIKEGEKARFTFKGEGVPAPICQWLTADRTNNEKILQGETNAELVVSNPPLGVSRYAVRLTNSAGTIQSKVATLSVDPKIKLAQPRLDSDSRGAARPAATYTKSEEDIERQRMRLQAEKAQKRSEKMRRWSTVTVVIAAATAVVTGAFALKKLASKKSPREQIASANGNITNNADTNAPEPTPPNPAANESFRSPTPQSSNSTGISPTSAGVSDGHSENSGTDSHVRELSAAGIPSSPLPSPWKDTSVGPFELPPIATHSDNAFHLTSSGTNLSEGIADNFLFVWQRKNSAIFEAPLVQTHGDKFYSRCGIMIRRSLQPNAPFVFIGVSSEALWWVARDQQGQPALPHWIKNLKIRPLFLQLTWTNRNFVGAYASNDVESIIKANWIPCWTNDTPWPYQDCFVGLAVCSGKTNEQVSAEFDMFSFLPRKNTP